MLHFSFVKIHASSRISLCGQVLPEAEGFEPRNHSQLLPATLEEQVDPAISSVFRGFLLFDFEFPFFHFI